MITCLIFTISPIISVTQVYFVMMFSIIKRAIKIFYFKLLRVSWYVPTRKSTNQFAGQVHVLVVKNTSYINFSRICIESFLHFHPKAKVILHCDTSTFNKAKRFFWVTTRYKNVSIIRQQYCNI